MCFQKHSNNSTKRRVATQKKTKNQKSIAEIGKTILNNNKFEKKRESNIFFFWSKTLNEWERGVHGNLLERRRGEEE